jgi:hypothetical protein
VPALIKKMKRARELVSGSTEAYQSLTESASAADILMWKKGERKAQDARVNDVSSMDYFAVKMDQGVYISILGCFSPS